MRLEVVLINSETNAWQGRIGVSGAGAMLGAPRALATGADTPGSCWIESGQLRFWQRLPKYVSGFQFTVHATGADASSLRIELVPMRRSPAGQAAFEIVVPLAELRGTESIVKRPLHDGATLYVRRIHGDELPIRIQSDSSVFLPNQPLHLDVFPRFLEFPQERGMQLRVRLISGESEITSGGSQHAPLAGLGIPMRQRPLLNRFTGAEKNASEKNTHETNTVLAELDLPDSFQNNPTHQIPVSLVLPSREGLYRLQIELLRKSEGNRMGTASRRETILHKKAIPLLIIDPNPQRDHTENTENTDNTDNAKNAGDGHARDDSALRWRRLRRGMIASPFPRFAQQHVTPPQGESSVSSPHATESSFLDTSSAHADFSGASHALFPGLSEPRREFLATFDRLETLRSFQCGDSLSSGSLIYYDIAVRLVEHLQSRGYSGAVLPFLEAGTALYPGVLLEPTPDAFLPTWNGDSHAVHFWKHAAPDAAPSVASSDSPDMLAAVFARLREQSGFDPAEACFHLFDREGLTLIPSLDFSSPLPALEERLRIDHRLLTELRWIGPNGAALQEEGSPIPPGGAAIVPLLAEILPFLVESSHRPERSPYYNILHPTVQSAMCDVVRELVFRYGKHPSFGGLLVRLSPHGYAQLPDPCWGMDDYTVARFQAEMEITIPGEENAISTAPDRFAKRWEYIRTHHLEAWIAWRARKVADFYRNLQIQIAETTRQVRNESLASSAQSARPLQAVGNTVWEAANRSIPLYLDGTESFDWSEGTSRLHAFGTRRMSASAQLRLIGLDPALLTSHPGIVFLRAYHSPDVAEFPAVAASLEREQADSPFAYAYATGFPSVAFAHCESRNPRSGEAPASVQSEAAPEESVQNREESGEKESMKESMPDWKKRKRFLQQLIATDVRNFHAEISWCREKNRQDTSSNAAIPYDTYDITGNPASIDSSTLPGDSAEDAESLRELIAAFRILPAVPFQTCVPFRITTFGDGKRGDFPGRGIAAIPPPEPADPSLPESPVDLTTSHAHLPRPGTTGSPSAPPAPSASTTQGSAPQDFPTQGVATQRFSGHAASTANSSDAVSMEPLLIRTTRAGDSVWIYLLNNAPCPIQVEIGFRNAGLSDTGLSGQKHEGTPLHGVVEPEENPDAHRGGSQIDPRFPHAPDQSFSGWIEATGLRSADEFQQEGASCRIKLKPYDLFVLKSNDSSNAIQTVRTHVSPPDDLLRHRHAQLASFARRIVLTRDGIAHGRLENPGFESTTHLEPVAGHVAKNSVPSEQAVLSNENNGLPVRRIDGWNLLGAASQTAVLDPAIRFAGRSSLKIEHSETTPGRSVVLSNRLEAITTGRLYVIAHVGIPQGRSARQAKSLSRDDTNALPTRLLPLRLSLVGRVAGRTFFRAVELDSLIANPSQQPLSSENGVAWYRLVVPFDRLPTEHLDELRLAWDVDRPGTVWIDEIALYRVALTSAEQNELLRMHYAAKTRLDEGNFSVVDAILDGYWPRFLEAHVPLPKMMSARQTQSGIPAASPARSAPAYGAEHKPTAPTAPSAPQQSSAPKPETPPGMWERVRGWFPR